MAYRILLVVALGAWGLSCSSGAPAACVTGASVACACVDGTMGAQVCQADATFGTCQCGTLACNSANCVGCCDATGKCSQGNTSAGCGSSGNACVMCGASQSCVTGVCTSGSGGGAGGGGGGGAGGGGVSCGPSNCSGCCMGNVCDNSGTKCGSGGGACCAANQQCEPSGCVTYKRIFLTRTQYTGNLGGLAGADQKCTTAATAATIGGGPWKAWLSDGTTDALTRIADVGPWYNLNSTSKQKVFNNKANLQTTPIAGVYYDELGMQNTSTDPWTGTLVGGGRAASTCLGWTSALGAESGVTGDGTSTGNTWTNLGLAACNTQRPIYCVEQ